MVVAARVAVVHSLRVTLYKKSPLAIFSVEGSVELHKFGVTQPLNAPLVLKGNIAPSVRGKRNYMKIC